MVKKFVPLNISSKFAICGLPIRVDTYKTCSFGCEYCFSNNRKICEFSKDALQVGDIGFVKRRLQRIFDEKKVRDGDFLDTLIANGYDWHLGGMSDPLQPAEMTHGVTKELIDVTNKYGIHILTSTKADTLYDCNFRPDLHSFQLSVTNVDNRTDIEPRVASIDKRFEFYKNLKKEGFKVGIRVQPFIPGVTSIDIIDMFKDADNFTIEGMKLVPQNEEQKQYMLDVTGLKKEDFTQKGLLSLKPEKRLELYKPFIEKLDQFGIQYSIADNDLRYLGNNKCCCGDNLVHKATSFNTTAMIYKYGADYSKKQVAVELDYCGVGCCKCNHLFTSNRQEGCRLVKEFYDKRFERKSSPFSPKYQYGA